MTTTPAEDDMTTAERISPVEIPGADLTHVVANVLNKAIDWEKAHSHDEAGDMFATAAMFKASDALSRAVRTYVATLTK